MWFDVKTDINVNIAKALARSTNRAEMEVAQRIRKDTSPYVPFRNGALDRDTRVVGNMVIYPPPYSRFLYYGKVMVDPETGSPWARENQRKVVTDRNLVFTTDFHPQAQAFWFEASKAQNLDNWLEVARKAVAKDGR